MKGIILAVDDTPTSLKLLTDLLKNEGYEVHSALNGEVALHSAAISPPDLVLLDIRMAGMDGFEVCRRLKAQPQTCAIPVIFVSAISATDDKVKGFGLGAVDFVTKPYHRDELLARVHTHMELTRLRRHLEDANRELEAFSYSVSHDLRAPLRAIDGFSRILLEEYNEKLDPEGRRLLNVVRDNTVKMGLLIDDILKFSRAGRLELNFAEIDMEELAHSVMEELKPGAVGRKLRVKISPLPRLSGDRAMLHQVFVNLLSNAIKFTRTREEAVIEVGSHIENNEAVYFVRDNGAGFDMQYADKLFGVFQRLHSESEFEGTGIGLAIVKRIVTRHGGHVWARSEPDKGATLYFALPIDRLERHDGGEN